MTTIKDLRVEMKELRAEIKDLGDLIHESKLATINSTNKLEQLSEFKIRLDKMEPRIDRVEKNQSWIWGAGTAVVTLGGTLGGFVFAYFKSKIL